MSDAPTVDPVVGRALASIVQGDVGAAVTLITAQADPMAHFDEAVKLVYRQTRDIDAMLAIAEGATNFAIDKDDLRLPLLRIQYNAASNFWPGWGDEGVTLSEAQIARGLALARQSLALREELGLAHGPLGKGHWLIGALLLAFNQNEAAASEFEAAGQAFTAANEPVDMLMAQGYRALAARRMGASDNFAKIITALEASSDKEAKFFLAQLNTAKRILIDG